LQRFQQQAAAEDLVACATTLKQLLGMPVVDEEKQRVTISSLITDFEAICLKELQSKSPDSAIEALRLMAQTSVTFGESFKDQILTLSPVVIKALPEEFLLPAAVPFNAGRAKVYQRAWAASVSLPVELTNSIGMKFVLIPPGEFMMGSPESEQGRELDETQHKVTLTKPFYIGMGEVTQEQGLIVVGTTPSQFKGLQNPVEMLSWDEAMAYCELLSALPEEEAAGRVYRLPTEAEWEYACRAGTETDYGFGSGAKDISFFAWHDGNSDDKTHPVGQGSPNSFGLYDINGNVWEWCADWYGTYPEGPVIDPSGPNIGLDRVCRGGGWDSSLTEFRSASRDSDDPSGRNSSQGFRLVLSLSGSPQ
jgi:formylglycine-generating enzyme required for sulfatase activity